MDSPFLFHVIKPFLREPEKISPEIIEKLRDTPSGDVWKKSLPDCKERNRMAGLTGLYLIDAWDFISPLRPAYEVETVYPGELCQVGDEGNFQHPRFREIGSQTLLSLLDLRTDSLRSVNLAFRQMIHSLLDQEHALIKGVETGSPIEERFCFKQETVLFLWSDRPVERGMHLSLWQNLALAVRFGDGHWVTT